MAWGNPLNGRWAELYKGTPGELALEPAVASLGLVYRTNLPLHLFEGGLTFFPDFLIPALGLVIEVDGREHRQPEKQKEDQARSRALHEVFGWTVVRCTNEEAILEPYSTVNRLLEEAGIVGYAARRPVEVAGRTPAQDHGLPAARSRSKHSKRRSSTAPSQSAVPGKRRRGNTLSPPSEPAAPRKRAGASSRAAVPTETPPEPRS